MVRTYDNYTLDVLDAFDSPDFDSLGWGHWPRTGGLYNWPSIIVVGGGWPEVCV